ncbi:hypothetical protein MCAP1_001614 [Malassezia caprae]|uniref:Splicing factor Cactin n=1 Tax=Malassezia caprae TaxID=1381934 RepID=A0AAF0E6C2_9BASI|nr:hypothetical protein MCAP1_001614 [Malassezia caprae]
MERARAEDRGADRTKRARWESPGGTREMVYADDDTDTFHWHKKEALDQRAGLSRGEVERREAARRADAAREFERLRMRRAARERAQAERDEERARRVRAADAAAMSDWAAREDEFLLEQAKNRALIRVREQRAKKIDLLLIHQLWWERVPRAEEEYDSDESDAGMDIALTEPRAFVQALTPEERDELRTDLASLAHWEKDARKSGVWRDLLLLCEDPARGDEPRLDPSIIADIDALLADKTASELETLQASIHAKLQSGEPLDVEYWESMQRRIVVWLSAARLRAVHEVVLTNRITALQRRQRREARRQTQDMEEQLDEPPPAAQPDTWDAAEMEPRGMCQADLPWDERELPARTWAEQRAALVAARRRILAQPFVPKVRASAVPPQPLARADEMVRREALKAMDVAEEAFNEDVSLAAQAFQWQDKYRARKPRYFNRVQTGYEWNRYNQTHYDAANPPPKLVQGYKFNIFYPDLLDPMQAPTYRVLPDPEGEGETVLLRFSAGPPYEDVAFRIVNRDWDFSFKRGFRCSFDRGVLQLYFHFKRLKYRK